MKLTVEIPDDLYRRAKIRAVERGSTLRELVMSSLEQELRDLNRGADEPAPFFAACTLLPKFKKLRDAGAFMGGTDSAETISEERDAR